LAFSELLLGTTVLWSQIQKLYRRSMIHIQRAWHWGIHQATHGCHLYAVTYCIRLWVCIFLAYASFWASFKLAWLWYPSFYQLPFVASLFRILLHFVTYLQSFTTYINTSFIPYSAKLWWGKLWWIECHSPIFYPTKFISIVCKTFDFQINICTCVSRGLRCEDVNLSVSALK